MRFRFNAFPFFVVGEKCIEQADDEVWMLAEHLLEGKVCLWVKITFCHYSTLMFAFLLQK